MVWCRDGVDMCGSICRDGVMLDPICYDGQEMCAAVALEGYATTRPTLIRDIQAPALNDANAQIRLGNTTGLPPACDPGGLHVRNGGIDTFVQRTGTGGDNLCTTGGSTAPSGPVGAYIGEVLDPANINGIAIEFVSASGLDLDSFGPLPANLQTGEPTPGSAKGPWLAQVSAGGVFSAYTSNTFVDPATIGYLFAGSFADGNVPGLTMAGHQYTMNVIYKIRYNSGTIISTAVTMVAEARGNAIPP